MFVLVYVADEGFSQELLLPDERGQLIVDRKAMLKRAIAAVPDEIRIHALTIGLTAESLERYKQLAES